MVYVGLDFGTSNSSVAYYNGKQIRLFNVDEGNFTPEMLRSILYIDRAYEHYLGSQAVEQFLKNETGRPVYWESQHIGTIETIWGGTPSTDGDPIHTINEVMMDVDMSAQGRLLQSIKTGLRNGFNYLQPNTRLSDLTKQGRIRIFDRNYPIEDLIAMLLERLRKNSEIILDQPVEGVVLGRPVRITKNPEHDRIAEDKLREAARLAGFKEVHFELEPVAAAYVYHQNVSERQNVLVFDFGGGTLDLTVMEVGGVKPPAVLATHGVLVGGDDLDRAMIRPLQPYFGEGSLLRDGRPLPAHMIDLLGSWQTIVQLSRPQYREVFRAARSGSNPEAIRRLETLVYKNLGFQLFQELEQAKIRLSKHSSTSIELHVNGLSISETVTQRQFETLIGTELEMVSDGIQVVMEKSGLKDTSIQRVLRTGGSSAIPAFIRLLEGRFSPNRVHELSPFTTIVGGLAIKAQQIETNGK